jgi:hypothetical protein
MSPIPGPHLRGWTLCLPAKLNTSAFVNVNAPMALDAAEKAAQRRLVRGVAGKHFVGERQPFRPHHQGDHHLHAVGPAIARIPMDRRLRCRLMEINPGWRALKRARSVIDDSA